MSNIIIDSSVIERTIKEYFPWMPHRMEERINQNMLKGDIIYFDIEDYQGVQMLHQHFIFTIQDRWWMHGSLKLVLEALIDKEDIIRAAKEMLNEGYCMDRYPNKHTIIKWNDASGPFYKHVKVEAKI